MTDTPWTREIVRCDGRREYLCQHGVGHPTPNSAAEHDGVHGCDGCCLTEEWRQAERKNVR